MLPIKIKWVNTETGEEYQNDDVSLHFKPLNSIGEPIPGFSGKMLSAVPQWLSKVITENVSKPCQFTGLHDSKGKEVFFGDAVIVACTCCKSTEIYFVVFKDTQIMLETPDLSRCMGKIHLSRMTLIGNRWEPIETLKQTAEEVSK